MIRPGTPLRWGSKPGRPPKILDVAVLVAAYRAGATLAALARAYGVGTVTIWRRLKEAGEPRRRPGRRAA